MTNTQQLYRIKKIHAIAKRAEAELFHGSCDFPSLCMDLEAADCHIRLNLDRLLVSDDLDFAYDVFGIIRHLNRKTAKLEHCFLPRHALPESDERAQGLPAEHPSWFVAPVVDESAT